MDKLLASLKYLLDTTGLRGLVAATGLLIALLAAIVLALTLTPLGGWVAELLGV